MQSTASMKNQEITKKTTCFSSSSSNPFSHCNLADDSLRLPALLHPIPKRNEESCPSFDFSLNFLKPSKKVQQAPQMRDSYYKGIRTGDQGPKPDPKCPGNLSEGPWIGRNKSQSTNAKKYFSPERNKEKPVNSTTTLFKTTPEPVLARFPRENYAQMSQTSKYIVSSLRKKKIEKEKLTETQLLQGVKSLGVKRPSIDSFSKEKIKEEESKGKIYSDDVSLEEYEEKEDERGFCNEFFLSMQSLEENESHQLRTREAQSSDLLSFNNFSLFDPKKPKKSEQRTKSTEKNEGINDKWTSPRKTKRNIRTRGKKKPSNNLENGEKLGENSSLFGDFSNGTFFSVLSGNLLDRINSTLDPDSHEIPPIDLIPNICLKS